MQLPFIGYPGTLTAARLVDEVVPATADREPPPQRNEPPLELRPFGRTGVSVRKLCLGHTMFGEYGTKDHDESIEIIHRAIDAGITFVDTADVCSQGDSEIIVVGWWQRMRTGATRQRALFASRSPAAVQSVPVGAS